MDKFKTIQLNKRKKIKSYIIERKNLFVKEDYGKNDSLQNEFYFYKKFKSEYIVNAKNISKNKIELELLRQYSTIKNKKINLNKELEELYSDLIIKNKKIKKDEIKKEFLRNLQRLLISKPAINYKKNKYEVFFNKIIYLIILPIIYLKFNKLFHKEYQCYRIHSDLHSNNIMYYKNKIKVIDWEDNKYGFYLTDIAFFNAIVNNNKTNFINENYLEEYKFMFNIYNSLINLNSSYRKTTLKNKLKYILTSLKNNIC